MSDTTALPDLTPEERARDQALCDAATPGPWAYVEDARCITNRWKIATACLAVALVMLIRDREDRTSRYEGEAQIACLRNMLRDVVDPTEVAVERDRDGQWSLMRSHAPSSDGSGFIETGRGCMLPPWVKS